MEEKKRYVPYPLKDENGKVIWKNMLKMDIVHIGFLIAIACLLFAYYQNTNECVAYLEDPCGYAKEAGCFVLEVNQSDDRMFGPGTEPISIGGIR